MERQINGEMRDMIVLRVSAEWFVYQWFGQGRRRGVSMGKYNATGDENPVNLCQSKPCGALIAGNPPALIKPRAISSSPAGDWPEAGLA